MPHDGQTQGPRGWPNILGLLRGTNLKVLGKAGATAGAGLAGGTTSGAPTSGQFDVGEAVIGQDGSLWICSVAGSPGTWVKVGGTTSPLSTKGDVWVYGSADARLGIGTDTYVLTADSTQTLGLKWAASSGGGSLSTVSNQIASDVSMSSANTYVDGPSVSCAAGTWHLCGSITVAAAIGAATSEVTAKLWDGTTASASGELTLEGGPFIGVMALAAIVTPGSTTTYKISAACNSTTGGAGKIKAATPTNAAGNTASTLVGVKVA